MSDLLRRLAPITDEAWTAIDDEARSTLTLTLAGRKLVEFSGPRGWSESAVSLGRVRRLEASLVDGAQTHLREVQPLVEVRVPFELERAELEALERGAPGPDLEPVVRAARTAALAEDRALFHGYGVAGIRGICEAASHEPATISQDYTKYPDLVADATSRLREAGVAGPFAIALGPRCYAGLTKTTTPGGYPVIEHVKRLLDGPVVWAPGLDGAVVMSQRGGDFELVVGRDFSIGYTAHSSTSVELYLEESFTFLVTGPEAAVPLRYR